MYKRKRLITAAVCVALCVCITAGALASVSAGSRREGGPLSPGSDFEIATNRHTQYAAPAAAVCSLTTDGFEKKLENTVLEIWFSEEAAALRVVDKRSGYIWGGTPVDGTADLNERWSARANALCTIRYYDAEYFEQIAALSEEDFRTQYIWSENALECRVSGVDIGIYFTFTMTLSGDALSFEMVDKATLEKSDNRLASVSFLNFFGCVLEDETPGYILLPDGAGALMRFRKAQNYSGGFEKRVFGADFSIDRVAEYSTMNGNRTDDYATAENQIALPVYGIVHGERQNAVMATIDSGSEYASILAMPAGSSNIRYSYVYTRFDYRQLYARRVSQASTVTVPQREPNAVNARLTYHFLTGDDADYSGIARRYRRQLLDDGMLHTEEQDTAEEIPLLLNVMMSEIKKGFLKNSLQPLTTVQEVEEMFTDLYAAGIRRQNVMLSGWAAGGYSGTRFGKLSPERKIGSASELDRLRTALEEKNGQLFLSSKAMQVNQDQITVGRMAAINASDNPMFVQIPNRQMMYNRQYYVKPSGTVSFIENMTQRYTAFPVHYAGLAQYLYADYTDGASLTRCASKELLTKAAKGVGQPLMTDGANLYMLPYISGVTDIPINNSQYLYETDTVPFLQMVLRGSIAYYAPCSNQGFYSDNAVLKMIEYGAFPSFLVMSEENFSLYNTPIADYFSLNYDDWRQTLIDVYTRVNEALGAVQGAAIVSHRALASGVAATAYDNGVCIYVNYNTVPYAASDTVTVPAVGCYVEEVRHG